ncbi:hypothetical protein V6N13_012943 [Hibiscus sabdariffa]
MDVRRRVVIIVGKRGGFGGHGDIIDQFIASKLDRTGKRFGFARFSNRADANRAIERLNGFFLFCNRLSVTEVKYKGRSAYWRKLNPGKAQVIPPRKVIPPTTSSSYPKAPAKPVDETVCDSQDSLKKPILKRILRYVEEEALRDVNKCLIGTMASLCSTSQVLNRLQAWGLNDITIKFMGGQLFHLPERITWVQISGIPLHCWNPTTLKRITDTWGSLISVRENVFQTIDCEKVSILISTQQRERINEVIEDEVGREVFLVQVYKLGLNLHSKQTANQIHPETTKNVVASLKSSSDSSSGSIQSTASSSGNCIGEDEVANAICLGKKPLVEVPSTFNESRSLSEEDLLGNFNPTELPSFKPLGNVSSKQDFNAPTSINAIEDQPGAQD